MRVVSTVGDCVVTVTVSATPDTFMLGVRRTDSPTVTSTSSWTSVAKPGQLERDRVASRRELQRDEPSVAIGDERAREVGVDVADFDIDAGQHRAAGIDHDPFDDCCRDLRLRPGG